MSDKELFYLLLQKRQFTETSAEFRALMEDENKRKGLEELAAAFECRIGWYKNAIYIIPLQSNEYLGFSRPDLREKLGKTDTASQLNLRLFIILTILVSFYDAQTSTRTVRPFLQLSQLMQDVAARLKEAARLEEESGTGSISYQEMYQVHEGLSGKDSTSQSSKKGFYMRVIRFLQEQNLITYLQTENQIRTLPMLDCKVDYMLRSEELAVRFTELKGGAQNAHSG